MLMSMNNNDCLLYTKIMQQNFYSAQIYYETTVLLFHPFHYVARS